MANKEMVQAMAVDRFEARCPVCKVAVGADREWRTNEHSKGVSMGALKKGPPFPLCSGSHKQITP